MRSNVTRYRIPWFLMTAVVQEFISRLERTTALLLAQELLTSKPWAYDKAIFSRNYETMNATLCTIMNDEAHNLRATFFFNKLVSHSQNIVLIPSTMPFTIPLTIHCVNNNVWFILSKGPSYYINKTIQERLC